MIAPLEDLVARFLRGEVPKNEWTHTAHLAVGSWHVHRFGPEGALERLRTGIRSLNDRHGTVNSDSSGYHETITVAYVRLIADFLAACADDEPLERRVERMIAGPLGDRAVLLGFWSQSLLMSERARREWVPPDLAPLEGCR